MMKRLMLYFSPIRLQNFCKPFDLIIDVGCNQIWVWCLNLDHMLKRQRSRLGLESLTDEQLHDIGLTRKDSETEQSKYFWQD